MTAFDFVVLIFVGLGAATGFMRGFVQEVLALSAWIFAVFAIRMLHTPLTMVLAEYVGGETGAGVLAFVLLLLVPYMAVRLIAKWAGGKSRKSVLGPVDRVLGMGFGAVKAIVIIVLGFSVLVLGYDTIWGVAGRPDWLTQSRSYSFVNASSDAMVKMIAQRRAEIMADDEAVSGAD
ncbi:CvpA family protein [Novosphingobium sp. YJ-S2-02]|uniref:CvpA family protein n=1 Tax=Novosphingobium aureum TaxID=2792964 RepID=A0A931HCW7_9SPHN|nr:CvpA family protein [Novosphingobium aureum]MBH0113163.1 CvpA family protein [Novosphingobium aureum]